MSDVFHSKWERRHGSLTALRHIVKLRGNSAGKSTEIPTHLVSRSLLNIITLIRDIMIFAIYC